MIRKGALRQLLSDPSTPCYVKLSDDDFGWWRLEDPSKEEARRMQVKMTDEQALSEEWVVARPTIRDVDI